MRDLKDKIVVITGASSGLGATLAKLVVQFGATPILIARSENKLKQVANSIHDQYQKQIEYYVADVTQLENVKDIFHSIYLKYTFIDILVNNAGFGIFRSFAETTESGFADMMNVNYLGTVYCTKQVLPTMLKEKQGHIINVVSQAGKVATPKSSAYSASKHALLGLTNSLRLEVQKNNILVTSINPGPIQTPFFNIADQDGQYAKNISKFMLQPHYVAQQIIKVMMKPKREVNLPRWMDVGGRLFTLFPNIMEKIVGQQLNRK